MSKRHVLNTSACSTDALNLPIARLPDCPIARLPEWYSTLLIYKVGQIHVIRFRIKLAFAIVHRCFFQVSSMVLFAIGKKFTETLTLNGKPFDDND
jgi:hypothetical protein